MKDLRSLHTHTAPEVIEYLEGLEARVAALEVGTGNDPAYPPYSDRQPSEEGV